MAVETKERVDIKVEIPVWYTGADLFNWKVWSWTVMRKGFTTEEFERQEPLHYVMAEGILKEEFGGGLDRVMVIAQMTDIRNTKIKVDFEMPLEPVVRRLRSDGEEGVLLHHIKFRPRMKEESNYVVDGEENDG